MSRIRRAVAADAPLVATMAAAVQRLHYEHQPEAYKPPDPTATVGWFERTLSDPDAAVFICEDAGGRPAGYIVSRARTSPEHAIKHASAFVEIVELGVAEGHQGTGIGRALCEHVIDHWTRAGATEFQLTVIGFNESARGFYERLGFSELSRRMRLTVR